jgi:hypothetical protein
MPIEDAPHRNPVLRIGAQTVQSALRINGALIPVRNRAELERLHKLLMAILQWDKAGNVTWYPG